MGLRDRFTLNQRRVARRLGSAGGSEVGSSRWTTTRSALLNGASGGRGALISRSELVNWRD